MSSNPDIIEISSDSDDSASSGWSNYFPPYVSTSSTKKPKRKMRTPSPSSSSDDDEPYILSKELPRALTQALETAILSMKKIPMPEKPVLPTKHAKQVLGLPCPRKWNGMQEQPRGVHKTMPSYKGKGKEAME